MLFTAIHYGEATFAGYSQVIANNELGIDVGGNESLVISWVVLEG